MNWTSDEDDIVREHYPVGGPTAVRSRLPQRSLRAIYVRAHRLCVPMAKSWQPWEDEVVTVCYRAMGARYIVERYLTHRTVRAIRLRALRLGVERDKNWRRLTPNYDCDYMMAAKIAVLPWRKGATCPGRKQQKRK